MIKPLVAALAMVAAFVGGCAVAVEEPSYVTVVKDGAFEVRDYPALAAAEVTVPGDQGQAASRGFRLLAAYIFGANSRRDSIAMTAPVAQTPSGETIAMTAPVVTAPDAERCTVRFTMPRDRPFDQLPIPKDPAVKLVRIPPQRMAVLRFSGIATQSAYDRKRAELLNILKARGLKPLGEVVLAQYDPPWTLWFMRRNEVMAPIQR